MDLREALYALETATRNIIGEPFFDGLIAKPHFGQVKRSVLMEPGSTDPLLGFASAGARLWLCLCQTIRVLGPTEYKVAARLNRARKRAPL